jgi:hypothetical protein
MSASPLEGITPAPTVAAVTRAAAVQDASISREEFRPLLGVLTAFWVYVALSNVMYAENMQASLSVQNIEHVFAAWDARIVQHLVLYPFFILAMHASLSTGWQPLRRALPLQLLCALAFAVLASPALVLGEYLTGLGHAGHGMHDEWASEWGSWQAFSNHEVPIWIASITSFLLTYGFGLALIMGFNFYRRLRDSELRAAALERALERRAPRGAAHAAVAAYAVQPAAYHPRPDHLGSRSGAGHGGAARGSVAPAAGAGEREFSRLSG